MSELNPQIPPSIFRKHVKTIDGVSKWIDLNSIDLFEGKKIVLFGLPGAFTPTCSGQQLPGFEALYHEFRLAGIDDIYCVSVNDTFVMNEWAIDQGLVNVKLIPDGSADFTIKLGMDVRKDNLGFGVRSWRYAGIYDDKELVWSGVEEGFGDDIEGDPYEKSKPENVLDNVKAFGWPAVTTSLNDEPVSNKLETFGDLDDAIAEAEGKHIDLEFSDSTTVKEKIR